MSRDHVAYIYCNAVQCHLFRLFGVQTCFISAWPLKIEYSGSSCVLSCWFLLCAMRLRYYNSHQRFMSPIFPKLFHLLASASLFIAVHWNETCYSSLRSGLTYIYGAWLSTAIFIIVYWHSFKRKSLWRLVSLLWCMKRQNYVDPEMAWKPSSASVDQLWFVKKAADDSLYLTS